MRILQNFDQSIATVLGDKVKARMTFKVQNLRASGMWSMR